MLIKKSFRVSERTAETIARISKEKNSTETIVLENALKLYSDYVYMQENASVIPQEIVKVLQSTVALAEQRINSKTNQVLSSLAIETCTLEQIVAASLDVSVGDVQQYRKNSVDWLKANQRVFRLDEVVE